MVSFPPALALPQIRAAAGAGGRLAPESFRTARPSPAAAPRPSRVLPSGPELVPLQIRFFLLQNRAGKTRLSKWYVTVEESEKRKIETEVFKLIS